VKIIVLTGSESFVGRVLVPCCRSRGMRLWASIGGPHLCGGVKADIRDANLADHFPEVAERGDPLGRGSHANPIAPPIRCLAYDVNVNGTANVICRRRARRISAIVLASRQWVYGDVRQ